MHPSMTIRSSARAAWIMRSASRMPPRLCQLDVDAVGVARGGGDVAAGCGSSRRPRSGSRSRRACSSAYPSRSAAGNGCSISSTPSACSSGTRSHASTRPSSASLASTRIERVGRLAADGAHPLEVVRAADLDLERVVAGRPPGAVGGALDGVDARWCSWSAGGVGSRPRMRYSGWPQILPSEIVQGAVDRALGRHVAGDLRQPLEDRVDGQRIVAEQRLDAAQELERARRSTRRNARRAPPRRSRPARRG